MARSSQEIEVPVGCQNVTYLTCLDPKVVHSFDGLSKYYVVDAVWQIDNLQVDRSLYSSQTFDVRQQCRRRAVH